MPSSGSADSEYLDTFENTESPNSELEMSQAITEEQKTIVDTAKLAAALLQTEPQGEQKEQVNTYDDNIVEAIVNLGQVPEEYSNAGRIQ
jgi:hypothetical protein